MSPSDLNWNGEVVGELVKEFKAIQFDNLYKAIEKHKWMVEHDPDMADETLYSVFDLVKRLLQEVK